MAARGGKARLRLTQHKNMTSERGAFMHPSVNADRNFSATGTGKVEIGGEFVPHFNKLCRKVPSEPGRTVSRRMSEREPAKSSADPESVMASKRKISRAPAQRRTVPGLAADFADFFHNLARTLFDPYRPEQHYMRGPGPKWHAKHDPAHASYEGISGVPVYARAKAR
jgi:hypothetical protein